MCRKLEKGGGTPLPEGREGDSCGFLLVSLQYHFWYQYTEVQDIMQN